MICSLPLCRYLYYKLRKKMAIHDVEKAMEDPQPVKFTSKISLRLSKNCFCNMFRLLCNRIKKRKTICDEESAIDKSQTTPKPSKPETITRNKDKKQKKKKDTMNKTVGEAIEMPSVQQETNEQVQTPALPKENVCIVIQPEEQCMVPLADLSREQEHVPTENDLSMIQEHVAPDIVSVSPIIPEFQQPFVERQKETPASITRYKRTIIFTWIDEITDDEDEASTPQAEK
ncbi:hypothetical protein XELAEV_18023751mg [Xenopus laevis]|uniref:Uncharacterized protein n=1 Tax=Xenopus laevis TaxID=8355 RepID=A0A974D796_XENLA|nr:hypothetical protein XELAEV_18023751mg [Xenopus laevis]